MIEFGLDELLFRSLTDQLVQAVNVDTTKQRLDSTAIRSAIRGLTRLGILVESMKKFLKELQRKHSRLYRAVDQEVIRKYVERQGDGCFADTRPSQSRRRLPEAATDIYEILEQYRKSTASRLESFRILDQVFQEQCELVANPDAPVAVRPPKKSKCNNIVNPADLDARYNKHRGTGYLVQVMETFAEDDSEDMETESQEAGQQPDLITRVAVTRMTSHDKDALEPAIDDVDHRGIKPRPYWPILITVPPSAYRRAANETWKSSRLLRLRKEGYKAS